MSKLKSEIVKPFIPSQDPICQIADLVLLWFVSAMALAAALVSLWRAWA